MSRILLADDSPHAQRMGEFILKEEGYEVVSVTDGQTAIVRLDDVEPDLILADVSLPGKSGYEICEYVKNHAKHGRASVLLTAGAMETINESECQRVGADGTLRKPFEASVMLQAVKRSLEAVERARPQKIETVAALAVEIPSPAAQAAEGEIPPQVAAEAEPEAALEPPPEATAPVDEAEQKGSELPGSAPPSPDAESVRAAVTLALEAALPVLIDEVTQRLLLALVEGEARHGASRAAEAASAD